MSSSDATESRGRTGVRSVDRAISIMEILGRDGAAGVTEIARELDVHKSTVFRLIATLEARGIVEQDPVTQKYRLGFAIARLASGLRDDVDVIELARDVCEELSARVDETVNLAMLADGEVVSVEQINLSSSLITVDWVGQRHPLHATATGKVFLAFGTAELRDANLRAPLARLTPSTITDREALLLELDEVREQGYATTSGELEVGLNAVAAPVREADGTVIASIVTSGPEYRLTEERLPKVGKLVSDAAADVSRRLGWLG
jgi:DNA-binding IclR family transcriptional regulator